MAALLLWPETHGQGLSDEKKAEITEYIDGLGGPDEPGIAVGVVRDGEIIHSQYLGLANLDHKIPIAPETRFNIASNAKQFTALMVLDLAEQGKIDLKADFRTYLPEALPSIEETISIEHLITHTSGIRDIYDLWALTGVTWYERPFDTRDAIELLNKQTGLNFTPGSRHKYSNSNYIFLAQLVSEVSGERFHKATRKFFDARNMPSTGVKRRYGEIIPDLARAYGNWNGWMENPAIANLHGDGFLFTTLPDQLEWEKQVQGTGQTLSPALMAESQGVVSEALTSRYGFGLEFSGYKGLDYAFHAGGTGGYNAYLMRFPEYATSVVVIGNTTEIGVAQTARKLADIVLADEIGPPVNRRKPVRLAAVPDATLLPGLYETEYGDRVTVTKTEEGLAASVFGGDPVPLKLEDTNFYAFGDLSHVKFAFEPSDHGLRLNVYAGSTTYETMQLPALPDDDDWAQSVAGRFMNAETDVEISLEYTGNNAFKISKEGRTREGEALGRDYLAMNSYRIMVLRDDAGAVKGLSVNNSRIENVRFDLIAE